MSEQLLEIMFWFCVSWIVVCGYVINVSLLHVWNIGRKSSGKTEKVGWLARIIMATATVVPFGVLLLIFALVILAILLGAANYVVRLLFYGEL